MRYFTSFLLLLMLSVTPGYAQWTKSKGLWGAIIKSMVTTDSSFLINSFGNHLHLYKTNQQGWEEKNAVGIDLFKLGDVLFSQDNWSRVYRSMDDGETWQNLTSGESFFCPTLTALFKSGLFRSYDYGDTWEDISDNAGLDENDYYYLKSWENALLVESVYDSILLISYDDGQEWTSLTLEDLPLEGYFYIHKLCIQNDEVWISTNLGIFRLPENESGWIPVDTATIHNPAIFFEFHDTLFIGSQQGCHYFNPEDSIWIPRNNGLKNPQVYSFTSWKDTLYCSSYPGIYKMVPDGEWSLWNSELSWIRIRRIFAHDSDVWVYSFEDDPFPGPYVYHFFRSSDNGENFLELDSGLIFSVKDLIMTDSLYYLNCQNGFFISDDYGDSWETFNDGFDTLLIYSIAVSRQYCYAGTPTGLFITSNPPGTWQRVPNPLGTVSVTDLAVNELIIICSALIDQSPYTLMRSEDGGITFEPVCIDYECSNNFNNVYQAPNFFGFGDDSSYYSTETGLEWVYIPVPVESGFLFRFSPGENCLLMAGGLYENFIYITYNMGLDWIDISDGLPPPTGSDIPIETHTINNQRIFTGVEYKGLWYRDDLLTSTRENDISGAGKMEAWPNPFTTDFYIKLNIPDKKISILRIYDLQGRLLYNENVMLTAQTRIFPTNCTKQGMYILQVYTNDQSYTIKLLKK